MYLLKIEDLPAKDINSIKDALGFMLECYKLGYACDLTSNLTGEVVASVYRDGGFYFADGIKFIH